MSQLLVGLINNLPTPISIWNSESSNNHATLAPGQVMIVQGSAGHWNIPDCSAEEYFAAHHMEIRSSPNGPAMYSFWDDDDLNYVIQYCPGTNYKLLSAMPGGNVKNGTNVVIQIDPTTGPSARVAVVAGS